jgi:pyruvate,water dikinase
MSAFVLDMAEAAGRSDVGGKARALADLVKAGFDVPPFFVILPSAFDGASLKPEAREELVPALGGLAGDRFAVRSSGGEEDGSADSHAGQYLSVLDVTREGVAEAAERVAASGRADSLRAYRASRGLGPEGGAPAVIVQRLVDARTAGVMFTADPLTGRRDRIVVTATAGLGDRLVAGEVDGTTYVFDRASGHLVEGPAYEPTPAEKARRPPRRRSSRNGWPHSATARRSILPRKAP